MAIPVEVRADAETALSHFCREHSSAETEQPRYTFEIEGTSALLIEQRPGFMKPEDLISKRLAKFRYSPARAVWSLYWADANERWHRVSSVPADKSIRALLQAVLSDPSGVFWS